MRSNNRFSGIENIGNIPWGTHFSLYYQTKKDLMDILIPYFKAGLENSEFCLWITPELLDVDEAITALRMTVHDLDFYLQKRQIEIIPYTHGYANENPADRLMTLNHFIEKTNQALASGYDGLRYSGNIFWSRKMGWQDLICYEESLDKIISDYHVLVLCAYFCDIYEITSIAETAYNHKFILARRNGRWEKIENQGRKRAEEAEAKLKETLCTLEDLIKERTQELEKAYSSLKEREESLAEAQKMAHIGDWIWDIKSDKAYWSNELYLIFGRCPQEPAPTYNEYLNYVHPDDLDYVANAFKKAAVYGKSYSIDHRIVLDNGEERTVHIKSKTVFDENNNPVQVKGIVQDITERKKAEEKIKAFANIVESSGDAIITTSLEGNVISWNKGAEQIYGYSPEEILGKNVSILETPNLKGEIKQLSEQIKQGGKVQQHETLRLKKDGSIINAAVTISPVFDSSGKLMAISGIVRDITGRIKAEKELAKSEEARVKEIHHRVKNNLQIISSLLSLQAEKFSNAEVLEAFKESQNRVGSMALIHEELYKRDNTNTLNFADYLLKLTTDLLNSYQVGRDNLSLKLELEQINLNIDTAIPLGIIVNELISNSLKHAFPNRQKGEIRISLQRAEDELNKERCTAVDECKQKSGFDYVLKVSDNGVGIPKGMDYQNAETLGLQLVNTLVEQIDGCMELKSDKGTEFIIWFNNLKM